MKTRENKASVDRFLSRVPNEKRRKDSLVLLEIMKSVTGKPAKMWGSSIVGFDKRRYKYADGRDGEICMIGFSPRVRSLSLYLSTKFNKGERLLKKLGHHKMSPGGCLYINSLKNIDLEILKEIVGESYAYQKETHASSNRI